MNKILPLFISCSHSVMFRMQGYFTMKERLTELENVHYCKIHKYSVSFILYYIFLFLVLHLIYFNLCDNNTVQKFDVNI